ncbi:hypothetical protein MSIMFI_05613 [Mycobacterium simulans]|nr:hypothetical protein MSIMFI_05613 [Mycobacterium simulans]
MRAGVSVDGRRIERHGMGQRHRYRCAGKITKQLVSTHDSPSVAGVSCFAVNPEAAQVVKPDHRIRPAQIHGGVQGVQIAQHTITEPIRQRAQLFFEFLDQRPQFRCASVHVAPL